MTTATEALPAARKSEAGMVAVSCVALTNVVVTVDFTFVVLVHCTTEQGSRFVPVTFRVTAELPAGADVWDSALIVGAARAAVGVEIVKGKLPEVPFEFVTVTATGAAKDTSDAGMAAVNCVALTNVVGCAVPFQFTTASFVKFVPFTVSVKPVGLQKGVEAAEVVEADSDEIAGDAPGAAATVKSTTFEISVVVVLLTFEVADEAEPGICTAT